MIIHKSHIIIIFLYILLVISCGEKRNIRKLEKFDSSAWISDKDGCNGTRLAMKDSLLKAKYRMRGLRIGEIKQLLGNPDAEELSDRNQKYYVYYLEPGPGCTKGSNSALSLFVRFSAVGIANELTLKNF